MSKVNKLMKALEDKEKEMSAEDIYLKLCVNNIKYEHPVPDKSTADKLIKEIKKIAYKDFPNDKGQSAFQIKYDEKKKKLILWFILESEQQGNGK